VIATTATLDEATEAVGGASVDLAILDVNLRGMSSYPVAELLIAHRTAFVFATSGTAARAPTGLAADAGAPEATPGARSRPTKRTALTDQQGLT
jgi:DNA-binding response OmpR family regulator